MTPIEKNNSGEPHHPGHIHKLEFGALPTVRKWAGFEAQRYKDGEFFREIDRINEREAIFKCRMKMNACYSCVWGQDSTNIPSPMSDGEWCWVQSSVPASCINLDLIDVGFIWELITLWQSRISMEGHKVSWFWWSAKAFVYRHCESFFSGWLHACVTKEKQHFGDVSSSGGMNQYAFCCAKRFPVTQASLSRHICNQHRPMHLPSLKLGIRAEKDPMIGLPHINRCTTTQTHSRTQTQLHLACVNKVLPTHRPICLIPFALSLCLNWRITLVLRTWFV